MKRGEDDAILRPPGEPFLGTSTGGGSGDPGQCPSCGAPLDRVNQAGTCEYCDAHITNGRFELGLGAGWHIWEATAYGYAFPDNAPS